MNDQALIGRRVAHLYDVHFLLSAYEGERVPDDVLWALEYSLDQAEHLMDAVERRAWMRHHLDLPVRDMGNPESR